MKWKKINEIPTYRGLKIVLYRSREGRLEVGIGDYDGKKHGWKWDEYFGRLLLWCNFPPIKQELYDEIVSKEKNR